MKTVNLPIVVPDSNYCFDGKECCYYFDNEGGHGQCALNIGTIETTKDMFYKKPKECIQLEGHHA